MLLKLVTISLRRLEYSVEGNPPHHEPAFQVKSKPFGLFGGLTLYVDMGRPVALNVRRNSLPSTVQGRVVLVTDSSCRCIEIMEAIRQRWKRS